MSLLNLLTGKSNENTEGTTNFRNTSGTLVLGGGAFLVAKENDFFRTPVSSAYNSLKSNKLIPENAQAGQAIRTGVDELKEIAEESKRKVLRDFQNQLLDDNRLNQLLSSSTTDEAKAFLSAMYDEISGREIETDFQDVLARIRKAAVAPTIEENDREAIKNFFRNNISNDTNSIERFQKAYNRRRKIGNLLQNKDTVFSPIDKQIQMEKFATYGEYVNSSKSGNLDTNILNKIDKRFNQIKGLAGREANVSLVGFNEYGNGTRSMYARVRFSDTKILNIPLHLEKNSNGMIYYRATENLSTRYQAPLKVIDANELLKGVSLTSTSSKAYNTAAMDFDQYMFKSITTNLENMTKFNNLSGRDINDINAYTRSFGIDVPRGLVYGSGSERLDKQLMQSRLTQSGIGFISGLEQMTSEQRKLVHKRLLQLFPDKFGGPPSSQTVLQRLENPFQRGSDLMFKNVQLLGEGVASIEQLDIYGRLDRSIQPQTAREQQMVGRYEVIESLKGVKSNATLTSNSTRNVIAEGGGLIGMKQGSLMYGANVSNIIAFGAEQQKKLGLSEGMTLFGGNMSISTSLTKTVVDEDLYQTKLMKKLIDAGKEGLKVGSENDAHMTVDQFFKEFGDEEGRAILGKLDKDFSAIKRKGGMEGMFLRVYATSQETGRNKYHIGGNMQRNFRSGKAFGTFLKDTLKNVNGKIFNEYLQRIGGGDLFQEAGLNYKTTMLTTDAFIKKSEQYIMTNMMGGLESLGGDSDLVKSMLTNAIGDDDTFLNKIKTRYGIDYQNLDSVTKEHRAGAQFHEFITAFVRAGSKLQGNQFKNLGYTLSYAAEMAQKGKFGLTVNSFKEAVSAGLSSDTSLLDPLLQNIETARSSGLMLGAGSVYAGSHQSELGRNLAKTEPRLANYLYSSLRSSFGFSQEEATSYIGSLVSRQQGIEGRANAVAGMQLVSESISSLSDKRVAEKMTQLGIEKFNKNEVKELLSFGQNEKDLIEFLNQRKQGGILDLEDIEFKDKNALKQLKEQLGGKSKIYLPGSDVFENMIGHEIRTTQKVLNIEAEYKRSMADFLTSVGSFQTAEGQAQLNTTTKSILSTKKSLATVAGTAIRESLSGRVLGSGSYAGAGLTLGGVGEEIYSSKDDVQSIVSGKFKKLYNKEKGYIAFIDAQTYLDGMTSYKAALKKDFPNKSSKEINNLMRQSLMDFFISIHTTEEEAISGLVQRNPTIGFGHYMPGLPMYRYDFLEEMQDDDFDKRMFSLLNEDTDEYSLRMTDDKKAEVKKAAYEAEKEKIFLERQEKVKAELESKGKNIDNLDDLVRQQKEITVEYKQYKADKKKFNKNLNEFFGAYTGEYNRYDETQSKFVPSGKKYKGTNTIYTGESLRTLLFNIDPSTSDAHLDKEITNRLNVIKEVFPELDKVNLNELKKDKDVAEGFIDYINKSMQNDLAETQLEDFNIGSKRMAVNQPFESSRTQLAYINKQLEDYFKIFNQTKLSDKEYKQRMKTAKKAAMKTAYEAAELADQYGNSIDGFERDYIKRSKSFFTLQEIGKNYGFNSLENFEEISFLRHTIGTDEVELTRGKKTKKYNINNLIGRVFDDVLYLHKTYGESGGGLVRFPNVNLNASILNEAGQEVGTYSGRMDFTRFAIGDYDADIYQIFFDTKRDLSGKIGKGGRDSGGLYEYGAKFLVTMQQLEAGMENLGKRLGSSNLTLMESAIDELEKERIIKDVGGLDVQVKTAMLGLVQSAAESGDFTQQMKLRGSGAALISVAQEVLAIKAKKLPLAADVASQFTNILREGFKTGKGAERLERFFLDNILKGTEFTKENKALRLANIDLSAIPEGEAKESLKRRLGDMRINISELFETFDVMFKTVHQRGMQLFGSNNKLLQALNKGGPNLMGMFDFLFSKYGSMEGGFLSKDFDIDELDNLMSKQQEVRKQIFNNFSFKMPKVGGLVGAGLAASYLVGSMQSVSQLETDNKFSDMKARESLSNKNLYRMEENRIQDVPVGMINSPQNFYQRPIHLNEHYVKMNTSQNVFAQAPTQSSGALLGKMISDAGGKANFMIHDQRHRISNYEITQNLLG